MQAVFPDWRGFVGLVILYCASSWCGPGNLFGTALAQAAFPAALYPVGMKQIEYTDTVEGDRHLAFALFYPAAALETTATPYKMTFFTNLNLHRDAPIASDRFKRPLIMFSHGAGSNGLYYAWFGEYLA